MKNTPHMYRVGSRLRLVALFAILLGWVVVGSFAQPACAERSVDGDEELLPIYETDAERAFRVMHPHAILANDPPPVGPLHSIAEFEPCTGALVRYPLGLPYSLIKELTEDVTVHVIVSSANYSTAVANFNVQGVNMSRVAWVIAPNNSIWTRDYGPWFVFDGNGHQVILDHYYNRPARPDDNNIPVVLGALWGIPVVTHGLWHTGGNYMSEGEGMAYSSDLVWTENASMSHAAIAQFMQDYYGVDDYDVLPDINLTGIHHIDTWGKLLDEETVLVKHVAPSNVDYARIEANAATLAGLANRYGRPFRVVRVFCPPITGGVAAYTNSLILNNRVLVPLFNLPAEDAAALQVYRDAMPGYEVIGFPYTGWIFDDALHCRVMGIHDRYMLRVDHDPVQAAVGGQGVPVAVYADDRSEAGLNAPATTLHWRVNGAPAFASVPLLPESAPDWYGAAIPAQPVGTDVEYYVTATDLTGRTVSRPRPAPLAVYHVHFDTATGVRPSNRVPTGNLSLTASPSPFQHGSTISFRLSQSGTAQLAVYDVRGREVARLMNRTLPAGMHDVVWSGDDAHGAPAPSGVYFLVLNAIGERATRRIVLVR